MGKYYIFCNNNQVYHALAHNSIMCRAFKLGDYGVVSTSFMAQNAIFVTREKVCKELLYLGASDVYYPAVLEIDDGCGEGDSTSSIPVRKVLVDGDTVSLSKDLTPLNHYKAEDGCIGAFAYGEIPLCYLSRILFLNGNDMRNFRKSSPDLWFPQDLFAQIDDGEVDCHLSKEILSFLSAEADNLLTPECIMSIQQSAVARDKEKAAYYHLIEATEDWNSNGIKTNVDGTLVRLLDRGGHILEDVAKTVACRISDKNSTGDTGSFFARYDNVLEADEETPQKIVFTKVKENLLKPNESAFVDQKVFHSIACQCEDALATDEEGREALISGLKAIKDYVYSHTEYDREATLSKLENYPVMQALFSFLDQSSDIDSLKKVCSRLPQEERRYAYMMFGWYHGMASVDGAMKSNRQLECRLSDIVVSQFPNDMMVSSAGGSQEFCHAEKEEPSTVYGITPHFSVWYDCESSLEMLLKKATAKQLDALYKKTNKPNQEASIKKPVRRSSAKDTSKNISGGGFYKLRKPVVPKNLPGMDELLSPPRHSTEEMEACIKSVVDLLRAQCTKENTEPDIDAYRAFFSSQKGRQSYQRYFAKHSDEIQELCRKVEK